MLRTLLLPLALATTAVFAADKPASDASIREMLQLTEARKLIDGVFPQLEGMVNASMRDALKGRTPSAEERQAMANMTAKMMKMMQDELSWDKLEPLYLRIYQKSFTQDELDGMIAFYRTPAGIALVKKLPVVMQETMGAMQAMMKPMMEKIQGMINETMAELQAERAKKR